MGLCWAGGLLGGLSDREHKQQERLQPPGWLLPPRARKAAQMDARSADRQPAHGDPAREDRSEGRRVEPQGKGEPVSEVGSDKRTFYNAHMVEENAMDIEAIIREGSEEQAGLMLMDLMEYAARLMRDLEARS